MLIPELRKRGLFWDGYALPGGTYRENLYAQPGAALPPKSHPASAFLWEPPHGDDDALIGGDADGAWETEQLDPMSMQLG